MTTGCLFGLGLGPGDPELVTLKALRLLRAAAVVAYPAPEHGDSFARQIVAGWLDRLVQTTAAVDGATGEVRGWWSEGQATGPTRDHPLDAVFVPVVTVYRNDDDLRDLIESLEAQETAVAEHVAAVERASDEGERRSLLNRFFPMNRKACEYPGHCPFANTATQPGVCYAGEDARRNPMATGAYKLREPNHAQERAAVAHVPSEPGLPS